MAVSDELYDRLFSELVSPEDPETAVAAAVFDTKMPDEDVYPVPALPVLVFQEISDVPSVKTIEGTIAIRESRWQVSVYATSTTAARAVKEAVITALHGYIGTAIRRCDFESAPGMIEEADLVPPRFHIPVDFTITQ